MRRNAAPVGARHSSKAFAASCTTSDLQIVEQELRDLLSGYHRLVDETQSLGPAPPLAQSTSAACASVLASSTAPLLQRAPSAEGNATAIPCADDPAKRTKESAASVGGSSPCGEGHRPGHSVTSLPVSSVRGDHSTDVAAPTPLRQPLSAATAAAEPAAREASPVDLFADVLNEDQLSRSFEMQWQQRPRGVLSLGAQCDMWGPPSDQYAAERQCAGSPVPPFAMRAPCHRYPEREQRPPAQAQRMYVVEDEDGEYEEDHDAQQPCRHRPYDAYDGQTFIAYRCERAPLLQSDVRRPRRRRALKGDSTTPEIATSARRTEDPSMRSGATGGKPNGPGAGPSPTAALVAPARAAGFATDAARFHVMVERGLAAIEAGERGAAADLPAFADSLVGAAVSAVSPAVRRRQARLRESLHAREAETIQRGAHRGNGGGTANTTTNTTPATSTTNVWSPRDPYRLARSVTEGKEISRCSAQMCYRAQRDRYARREYQAN